jgi:hypothetical protein
VHKSYIKKKLLTNKLVYNKRTIEKRKKKAHIFESDHNAFTKNSNIYTPEVNMSVTVVSVSDSGEEEEKEIPL